MRAIATTGLRALVIASAWCVLGVGLNFISAKPIPWIYAPPKFVDLEGVKVQLIDEKQAKEFMESADTVFVDSRKQDDYAKSHVKGSIFLSPDELQERFVSVEPLLPQDSRIVLYCYGPECDMAEQVAVFLAQMGYRNLAIMSAGFAAWEKAGYSVESAADRSENLDFWEQEEERQVCCEIVRVAPFLGHLWSFRSGVRGEAVV
jgi:rhodanese-related sulfurtransferase